MAKTATKMTLPSSKVDIRLTAGSVEPAMKAADAKSTKLFNVPIAKIKPIPGFNVRVDSPDYREHRDMLAASMRANGYDRTKALAGFVAKEGDDNVIYVTDGYTRLDAASIVHGEGVEGFDNLPVIVRTPAPSLTDLTVALHTNNTGRPLTPFELGVVVKRLLKEDGADKAKIAERLAVTPRYLDDVLLLVNGPKEVRTAVLEGTVSSTLAIQELRAAGDKPEKAVEKITAALAKSGGKKVTKKALGPKMQKVRSTVSIATGTDMKEIVKAVAALVRKAIPAESDGDGEDAIKLATVDGTINLVIEVPAPEPAPKPAKKSAAKKTGTKKTGAKSTAKTGTDEKAKTTGKKSAKAEAPVPTLDDAEPKAETPKKGKGKKAAKPAPEPDADDENLTADGDDDLGIDGAEEVTSDGIDDEIAPTPIAVKNGEGVDDDADVDI